MADKQPRTGFKSFEVPYGWIEFPRMSEIIDNHFIVFKTLLDSKYDNKIPKEKRFNWKILQSSVERFHKKLGMVIDLTNTERYYNATELEESCIHKKLMCNGFKEAPTPELTEQFIKIVQSFTESHPDELIGVHCTHGYNRSGFCIVAYFVSILGKNLRAAVDDFAKARYPGIYKEKYLDELSQRYGEKNSKLTLPPLPDWLVKYVDSNKESRRKPNSVAKVKGVFMDGVVQNIETISDQHLLTELRNTVLQMCNYKGTNFPGTQPVTMSKKNVNMLKEAKYLVSWKADGQRCMMLIRGKHEIYLFDRDFAAYKVKSEKMKFPQRRYASEHVHDTLLDGEMVVDKCEGGNRPRYLIFDIITFLKADVKGWDFEKRQSLVNDEIIFPRDYLRSMHKLEETKEPFGVRVKGFWDITKAREILDDNFRKQVLHEMDGLIFQPVNDPYKTGECPKILKWKPPEQMSVDFRLSIEKQEGYGLLTCQIGKLYVGGSKAWFGKMNVTKNLMQYDKKIVECTPENIREKRWKFVRERKDKSFPNHLKIAEEISSIIQDSVTQEQLYDIIENHSYQVRQKVHAQQQVLGQHFPRQISKHRLQQTGSSATLSNRGQKRGLENSNSNANFKINEMPAGAVGFTVPMGDSLELTKPPAKRPYVQQMPVKKTEKVHEVNQKVHEVNQKVQDLEKVEKKLHDKINASKENKSSQEIARLEKLKEQDISIDLFPSDNQKQNLPDMADNIDEAAKRQSCGGIAYDVIIKPASGELPHVLPTSPTREKPSISQEDIDRKLKEAEERRRQLEAQTLQTLIKETEKVHEVNQKVQDLEENFSKEVEKKLHYKINASEENKRAQEIARLEKPKEHDRHVEEVRKKKLEQASSSGGVSPDA